MIDSANITTGLRARFRNLVASTSGTKISSASILLSLGMSNDIFLFVFLIYLDWL